jgi:hypothetical protein
MILWAPSNTFGTPVNGTNYTVGGTVAGGGTVLYKGSELNFNHTSLSSNTRYYYKAFSYDGSYTYSSAKSADATTFCGVASLPLNQSFATSTLPSCWTTQYTGNNAVDKWTVSNTTNAGGTAYEMKSTWQSVNPGVTRLVTIPFSTVGISQLNLNFRHMLDAFATGCMLRVQSSTNGVNWTNEAWSVAVTSTNIPATLVTTTIDNNLNSPNTLIAFTIEGDLYQYDYWYIDDVTITPNVKTVNLTLFLEGLFNGTYMNKAQNGSGNQYPGNIADLIQVELHNSTSPFALAGGPYTADLSIAGVASVSVPASLTSSYYIVVKHRNSLETWTSAPVSFGSATIPYDFSFSASQAYGNNMKLFGEKYVIYTGDINQDGIIDSGDMIPLDNDATAFLSGYVLTDLNGDGLVDSGDMILLDNNSAAFITKITP